MNEPVSPDIEELLHAEKVIDPVAVARRERVMHRLESSVAALALGAAATGGGAALGVAGSLTSRLGRLLQAKTSVAGIALAVGAGSGAAVGYRAGEHAADVRAARVASAPAVATAVRKASQPDAPPTSAMPPNEAADRPAPPAIATVPVAPAAPPRSSSGARAPVADASGRDQNLAAEVALVQMARTALGRGDNVGALDAASAHARQYPHGRMVEERESIAIQALAAAQRGDEARARAAEFKAKYPKSILLPAVDMAVRSIP